MSKNKLVRKKGGDIGLVWALLAPDYGLLLRVIIILGYLKDSNAAANSVDTGIS